MAGSLVLRLLVLAAVIAVVVAVYSPSGSLALTSAFGLLRSISLGIIGLGLLLTGTGFFWLFGAMLFGFALYFGWGHKDHFSQSTDIRAKLNG